MVTQNKMLLDHDLVHKDEDCWYRSTRRRVALKFNNNFEPNNFCKINVSSFVITAN
jgi:hypothetical protein